MNNNNIYLGKIIIVFGFKLGEKEIIENINGNELKIIYSNDKEILVKKLKINIKHQNSLLEKIVEKGYYYNWGSYTLVKEIKKHTKDSLQDYIDYCLIKDTVVFIIGDTINKEINLHNELGMVCKEYGFNFENVINTTNKEYISNDKSSKLLILSSPTPILFQRVIGDIIISGSNPSIFYNGQGNPDGSILLGNGQYYAPSQFKNKMRNYTFLAAQQKGDQGFHNDIEVNINFILNCCYSLQFYNNLFDDGFIMSIHQALQHSLCVPYEEMGTILKKIQQDLKQGDTTSHDEMFKTIYKNQPHFHHGFSEDSTYICVSFFSFSDKISEGMLQLYFNFNNIDEIINSKGTRNLFTNNFKQD